MTPIVAIVGRPNVGKSTLFNRIVGKRMAIVEDTPGVTRDRNYSDAVWNGKVFTLIDTGGYLPKSQSEIDNAVREQSLFAIDEADVILLVVDVRAGITGIDADVASLLRKQSGHQKKKKVLLVVNKVDDSKQLGDIEDFRRLGLGEPLAVSSNSGTGTGDLLDEMTKDFTPEDPNATNDNEVKIAVVGRPNVGKSSFVNAVLGTNRQIVTPIAGTTRDAIDSHFSREGTDYILIDTAGLRKRAKVEENIEFFSTLRTEKAIERCDVALVLIDAVVGLDKQDMTIINLAARKKKGILLVINKWDLVEKVTMTAVDFERQAKERLKSFEYVPIIFISSVTKQRVFSAIDMARKIWVERRKRIDTSTLNDILLNDIKASPPWSKSGKEIKVKYISQLAADPPLFGFFAGNAQLVEPAYKKFIERRIREHFGFLGTPIELKFRDK
jgi:GTP-binding protein